MNTNTKNSNKESSKSDKNNYPVWIEKPVPTTGLVKINRKLFQEQWIAKEHTSMVVQSSGGSFRLCNDHIRVTVSAEDALWIIKTCELLPKISPIIRTVVIWSED